MQNRLCILLLTLLAFSAATQAQTTSQDSTPASAAEAAKPNPEIRMPKEGAGTTESKTTKILSSDVRVLIDISGSMKQTDPQNLRKPALDLIVRLLPDKSRAGVWTFGNTVNMLVPFSPVDAAWRKQAAPKANEISSIAMYTNIGKALEEASFDKKNLSAEYKTNIILLTDGVVDIGKSAVNNSKERQRIISEIIPELQAAGYLVHTIALSENSDIALLKKISISTDGIYTLADSADQLMGVFLKIFDQAVPAERVPLENNGFLVDDSIKEFTALIFRKPGEDRTVIASPDGKEYSATNPKDGINWYRTAAYDLITADQPTAGQWKIKTEIAPQSRITVVSNLQLVVEPLKNNIHSNDKLPLTYSFQENGQTITNKDFLGLIEANAIVAQEKSGESNNSVFTAATPPADGLFRQTLNSFPRVGDYELHLFVDGKTFKREFKFSLSVRDSFMAVEKNNTTAEGGKITYTYKISTDDKIVDIPKTQVSVSIKNAQTSMEKTLNLLDNKRWEFSFSPVQEGDYTIDLHVQGELLEGGKLDETLHLDSFSYKLKKAEPATSTSTPAEETLKPQDEAAVDDSSDLMVYIAMAIGNLLLIIIIYFAYKFFMGSKAKDELDEFEKTLQADAVPDNPDRIQSVKAGAEKTEIDLSDEDPAHIPMNNDDDLDKLFPLDSMDEPSNVDENK